MSLRDVKPYLLGGEDMHLSLLYSILGCIATQQVTVISRSTNSLRLSRQGNSMKERLRVVREVLTLTLVLLRVRLKCPSLRIGQIIFLALEQEGVDLFNVTNKHLVKCLKDYFNKRVVLY